MVANLSTATVERALLTDPSRCPSCGSALAGPRCQACGVRLDGSDGARLWDVSTRAARLLDQREQILGVLRRAAATAQPATPPATQPATEPPATATAEAPAEPQVSGVPAASPAPPAVTPIR